MFVTKCCVDVCIVILIIVSNFFYNVLHVFMFNILIIILHFVLILSFSFFLANHHVYNC